MTQWMYKTRTLPVRELFEIEFWEKAGIESSNVGSK